jgi:penicillin-binding protein 1C
MLDNDIIATTTTYHQIGTSPEKGMHTITITDELGNSVTRNFEIVSDK